MSRARTPAGTFARLLLGSKKALYALDAERKIIFASAGLLEWLGVEESKLIGLRCDYHSAVEGSSPLGIAADLCPPPEALLAARARFLLQFRSAGLARGAEAIALPAKDEAELAQGGSAPVVLVILDDASCTPEEAERHSQPSDNESQALHKRLAELRRRTASHYRFDCWIGESPAMRRVRAQAELAEKSISGVLIVGPRGSGREHLARSIHQAADGGAAGPLVPLACPLLDAESLQATIRHLKRRSRDSAHPEVLLLLDVDQMPAEAQAELAGFLNLPDFRLPTLATARRALAEMAAAGAFRRDLACTLSTLVIELPPLAERREDIPLVAQRLLEEHKRAPGAQLSGFTSEALDELAAYPWPGNLDELAEFVAEACDRAAGPWVKSGDLPARIRLAAGAAALSRPQEEQIVLDEFLAEIERELIERALARAKGNRTKAATLLGVSRARLLRRLVQLGLAEPAAAEETAITFEEVEFVPHEGEE